MQKLNPHTLFSIFEKGDEEVYKEHGAEDLLDNPFVLYTIGDSYDKKSTSTALNTLLDYFESVEQYEKCQSIVTYIQMLVLEEAKNLLK